MLNQLRTWAYVVSFLFTTLLAGCSEDNQEQQAKKEPYHPITNPSPEQRAQREAEEKARLPLTNELPDLRKAERSQYADMAEPLMPMRVYLANRNWEETPERVAEDVGKLGFKKEGISPELIERLYANEQKYGRQGTPEELVELTHRYSEESNAFEKVDLANAINNFVTSQASTFNGTRLVKIVLDRFIHPYDLSEKTFKIDKNVFTDKISYTKEEHEAMRLLRRIPIPPLKGYIESKHGDYLYGFTGASSLENIKVEDESIARTIEAARQDAKMVVYGYVKRVQRAHNKGVPTDKPYTFIQPHFADIIKGDGEILYTVEF